MPALVGPFVGFALGVALAWLCRDDADRDDAPALRRKALVVALFAGLCFVPVCAYFLVFARDWSLSYLVDSRAVPSAALLVLLVADGALVVAGFWAGLRAVRRRAYRELTALGVGPAAVALVLVAVLLQRLRVDGTFHQVVARFGTQPVAGGPLGWAILWMNGMLAVGFVIAATALTDRTQPSSKGPPPPPPPRPPASSAPETPLALLGRRLR